MPYEVAHRQNHLFGVPIFANSRSSPRGSRLPLRRGRRAPRVREEEQAEIEANSANLNNCVRGREQLFHLR
jgi:hypothetical protein